MIRPTATRTPRPARRGFSSPAPDPENDGRDAPPDFKQHRRQKPPAVDLSRPDRLPPHSPEAEQGVLGCCLLAPPESIAKAIEKGCLSGWFYDLRHQTLWLEFVEMHAKRAPIDLISVQQRLKDRKQLEDVGGLAYVSGLMDAVPSAANLAYYLDIVGEKARLRAGAQAATEFLATLHEQEGEVGPLLKEFAARMKAATHDEHARAQRPPLTIRRANEREGYVAPVETFLIGDNEIRKGMEGLVVIAGPGGAGKSLLVANLALAGAVGSGTWMGRKVHRRFRTLIIQAEVGPGRLAETTRAFKRNHPRVNVEEFVFFSDPPEGGMSINDDAFWAAVKTHIEDLKPDLVIFDPISHFGVKDDGAEVADALRKIRQAVGTGELAPGIVLITHTRKPRDEKAVRGRNLAHCVMGSAAWVNTSRCTYMLLPWDDEDLKDERVYFACPKLNDGANFAPTVWARKVGTFFEHDAKTNPLDWGRKAEDEGADRKFTEAHLEAAFAAEDVAAMGKSELARALVKAAGGGTYQTAMRAIQLGAKHGMDYLAHRLVITQGGLLMLKG